MGSAVPASVSKGGLPPWRQEIHLAASGSYLLLLGALEVAQTPFSRTKRFVNNAVQSILKGGKAPGLSTRDEKVLGETNGVAGKVCVVTGGSAGLGLTTAAELAAKGAVVVIGCRSPSKGLAAARKIRSDVTSQGGEVHVAQLDLATLKGVREFAKEVERRGWDPQILVNNAGIMAPPEHSLSVDGFEAQWQVNFLGHFLLTQLLLDLKAKNRKKRKNIDLKTGENDFLRVVNLSSMTHYGGHIFWKDVNFRTTKYRPFLAYAQSKLAIVAVTKELQSRRSHVVAVSVHPGLVDTQLARGFFESCVPRVVRPLLIPLFPLLLKTPEEAVQSVMYAITAPSQSVAGKYVSERKVVECSKRAECPDIGKELWEMAMKSVMLRRANELETNG